jgi:hypothetical protein
MTSGPLSLVLLGSDAALVLTVFSLLTWRTSAEPIELAIPYLPRHATDSVSRYGHPAALTAPIRPTGIPITNDLDGLPSRKVLACPTTHPRIIQALVYAGFGWTLVGHR